MNRLDRAREAMRGTWPLVIILGAFMARAVTLDWSPYGWYHGFNEAYYAGIADRLSWSDLVPRREGGAAFFDTGPLTMWIMAATRGVLGASEQSSRLAGLLALPVALLAVAHLHSGHRRAWGVALVATSPLVVLWFGRAQTDAWMTAGILLYLAGLHCIRSRAGPWWAAAGLAIALLAKQPSGLALLALLFMAPGERRRAGVASMVGLAVAGAWWLLMAATHTDAMMDTLAWHATGRSAAFGNAALVVLHLAYAIVPLAPLVWAARRRVWALFLGEAGLGRSTIRTLTVGAAFAAFALLDSPAMHEYYALPAAALAAALPWPVGRLSGAVAVCLGIALSIALLAWAGDLGDDRMTETSDALLDLDADAPIHAWAQVVPQLRHYSGLDVHHVGASDPTQHGGYVVWPRPLDCAALSQYPGPGPDWTLYDCRTPGGNP